MTQNMSYGFRMAVQHYMQKPQILTHSQKVRRLYKRCLKTAFNWYVMRDRCIEAADEIRGRFDENKDLDPQSKKVEVLLKAAEDELYSWMHPDPYVCPHMPSGTLYMRNAPVPLVAIYGDKLPEGVVETPPRNIDYSRVREGEMAAAGRVLVNAATKEIY